MKQSIKERIHALRMTFRPNNIKAFIIPSTDPHLSEYVAPYWMSREWISGFTGSAGTAVILMDKAGLWADSRYFLQAEKELEGSGITLYKEMLPETPSITKFLCQNLKPGESVSIDGENVFRATGGTNERRSCPLSVTGQSVWRSSEKHLEGPSIHA